MNRISTMLQWLFVIGSGVALGWAIALTIEANRLGFADKTLWNWIEVLLVPTVVAIVGFWYSDTQKKAELEAAAAERKNDFYITQTRLQQKTLEDYFDRMSELILTENLTSQVNLGAVKIARTRTLMTIRELNAHKNMQIVQFLRESELFGNGGMLKLDNADLSGIDLQGAD